MNEKDKTPNGEYTNFNNYIIKDEPAVQTSGTTHQAAADEQDGNRYVYVSRGISGLGTGSILMAIFGWCCFFPAFAGVALGIIGIVRNKKDTLSWIGLILSAFVIIYTVIRVIQLMNDPAQMAELMEQYAALMELSGEGMVSGTR